MIEKEKKIFRKMFIVTEYAALRRFQYDYTQKEFSLKKKANITILIGKGILSCRMFWFSKYLIFSDCINDNQSYKAFR